MVLYGILYGFAMYQLERDLEKSAPVFVNVLAVDRSAWPVSMGAIHRPSQPVIGDLGPDIRYNGDIGIGQGGCDVQI